MRIFFNTTDYPFGSISLVAQDITDNGMGY